MTPQKFLAEFTGTAALLVSVVGSSFMAAKLTDDNAVALLANALVTAAVLAIIIKSFQTVSGSHFNPAVTVALAIKGKCTLKDTGAYIAAQTLGAIFGVVLANAMFAESLIQMSENNRSTYQNWIGEIVATGGLISLALFTKAKFAWKLIPLWIFGAYFFTASTSFANPAVTIARSLTNSPAGIAPESILVFVLVQLSVAICIAVLIKEKK